MYYNTMFIAYQDPTPAFAGHVPECLNHMPLERFPLPYFVKYIIVCIYNICIYLFVLFMRLRLMS